MAAKSPRINQRAAITIHYDGMLRRPALHLLRFRGGIYEPLVGSKEKREAPPLNYERQCNRVLIVFEQRTVAGAVARQRRIDDSALVSFPDRAIVFTTPQRAKRPSG